MAERRRQLLAMLAPLLSGAAVMLAVFPSGDRFERAAAAIAAGGLEIMASAFALASWRAKRTPRQARETDGIG